MAFLAFLQSIKAFCDIRHYLETSRCRFSLAMIAVLVLVFFSFYNLVIRKDGNQHYNNTLRDNEIYRNISEALKTCGNKSSVMIGAVNLGQKVGAIKDFYSCDNKDCPINTKEKNINYRKSYVVDDETYVYLQEVGKTDQVQTISLVDGDIIAPLTKRRLKIEELLTLHSLITMSDWYNDGQLKILKLGAIVDPQDSVIFTISFTAANECLVADNLITDIKQTINQSRTKNGILLY